MGSESLSGVEEAEKCSGFERRLQWRAGNSKDIDEMLDFTLARFVAEVRKEDGQEYPGKTLYEILSSIQMCLRVQCK